MLCSICLQIWKTQQWATGLEKVSWHFNPKECSNYCTIALISHASRIMLKILQARLQQYMNYEIPEVQAGFRKGRGTRDQIASIHWIIKKATEFQKNIYFCFTDYAKAFDCVDHNKLWKILKEVGIPDHLSCLLRNLYASQEATVRTGHRLVSNQEKNMSRLYIVTFLFNLYAEYIMWNPGLDEAQAGIKIDRGEMSITSDMQMTPLLRQKERKNLRATWWKWKRGVKKLA